MAISDDLFHAILAMGSYNRRYNAGLSNAHGLGNVGSTGGMPKEQRRFVSLGSAIVPRLAARAVRRGSRPRERVEHGADLVEP